MWSILSSPTRTFIAFAWAGFLLYWVISAPGSNLREKIWNWTLTLVLLIAAIGLFILIGGGSIPDNLNPVLWHDTLPVGLCADVVVLLGVFVLIWARRTLGSNWSAIVSTKRDTELVQSGPYAHVRHPIYTGFIGAVFGTAIAYGRLIGILIFAICTAGLYVKSLREESVLTKKFQENYLAYKAKTKTLIPFIL
jgi:protein-S-isoprenylcysteine O-methyltransferase Ste14